MGRVLLVVGILIALAPAVASAAVPAFNTTQLYSAAEFAAAIKPYADSIARNANDAEAHYWLGVAYLYAFKLYRFGAAPYAGEFGGKAIASLERSSELKAQPAAMMALAEAYIATGDFGKLPGLLDRLLGAAAPLPLK